MPRLEIHLPAGSSSRADRMISEQVTGLSRRRAQALLEQGLIRIDGRRVRKGDVFSGERVLEVEILAALDPEIAPEPDLEIPILHQDESSVAVDKPAGRPAQALRSSARGTVANFLAARFPETLLAGGSPLESGLVHRLDTDTSGVLLAARSREAWLELRRQFREGGVRKIYLALVHGRTPQAAEIARAIEPDPRSRRRVRVLADGERSQRARPALTRYRALARSGAFTLLEVEIETGVMHQIRAHLAAAGHPVAGDELYGGSRLEVCSRQLLHAACLEFTSPGSAERVRVDSPLPSDFAAVLEMHSMTP